MMDVVFSVCIVRRGYVGAPPPPGDVSSVT